MRITQTDNYKHEYDCSLSDCDRHYCDEHRLLWRDCDTAVKGIDGDYADGRPHYIWDLGDCPMCEADSRRKRLFRDLRSEYPKSAICPECFYMDTRADNVAMHMIKTHGKDEEWTRLWLRDEIEQTGGLRR